MKLFKPLQPLASKKPKHQTEAEKKAEMERELEETRKRIRAELFQDVPKVDNDKPE